jgi:hypothetical protein
LGGFAQICDLYLTQQGIFLALLSADLPSTLALGRRLPGHDECSRQV